MKLRTTPLAAAGDRDLQRELRSHASAVNAALTMIENGFPYVVLQELVAQPASMLANMMVLADGTLWDPGSGAGIYRRDPTNTSWIYVG